MPRDCIDITAMSQHHISPLHIDSSAGEPYLRLPAPLDNIVITPPRKDDAASLIPILNDPAVYKWLAGIPHPYTEKDAREWLGISTERSAKILRELDGEGEIKTASGCPVTSIREVKEDGTQILIGSVGVFRSSFSYLEDLEEGTKLAEENSRREVGDPDIVWTIGDYLDPRMHGRGIMIMTVAIATIIQEWMVPRMKAKCIRVDPYLGNIASVRVFEKNGFSCEGTTQKHILTLGGDTHNGQYVLCWRQ